MKAANYHTLGIMLQAMAEACFRAEEQEKKGEAVTSCGMSKEDINSLCEDYLPYMLNPIMSTEEVKDRLGVSDATLNRMVQRGDIPEGHSKKRGTTRYWKKWDIIHFLRKKK